MTYLTLEEYTLLGGENKKLTSLDLINASLKFKRLVYPNDVLIDRWYTKNESYPLEVKLAMVEFVDYITNNAKRFNTLPIASQMVGSLSMSYSNVSAKNFNNVKFSFPESVTAILKPTNLLNPSIWNIKTATGRFTLFDREMFVTIQEEINANASTGDTETDEFTDGNGNVLFTTEEFFRTSPYMSINVYDSGKQVELNEDGTPSNMLSDNRDHKYLGSVKGWFRDGTYKSDQRGVLWVSSETVQGGKILEIKKDYVVKFKINNLTHTFIVGGVDEHPNGVGGTHHYMIYLS